MGQDDACLPLLIMMFLLGNFLNALPPAPPALPLLSNTGVAHCFISILFLFHFRSHFSHATITARLPTPEAALLDATCGALFIALFTLLSPSLPPRRRADSAASPRFLPRLTVNTPPGAMSPPCRPLILEWLYATFSLMPLHD